MIKRKNWTKKMLAVAVVSLSGMHSSSRASDDEPGVY